VLKGAFLFLKKKNKKWNVSNISKSKKNLPFHLIYHSRIQYLKDQNPNSKNIFKEKKKRNVSNIPKLKKYLFPFLTYSNLKFKSRKHP
jgi:hypothetical protein